MNIILRELRASIKSMVIWCGVFTILIFMYMSEFSAYANNEEMLAVLDGMPEAMLEAFQMNSFNLTTLTGFYGILFTYFILMLSIHAILKGNSIISKEERDRTVEFTLVLPIKRSKVVIGKLIAVIINCIIIDVFLYGIILFSIQSYLPEENFMEFLLLLFTSTFIMQMLFLSLGIMFGCALKQYKRSGYLGISIILISYVLSIVSGLSEKLEFLKYITPFKFFDTAVIKNEMALDWKYILISFTIIVICLTIGLITYKKRDLYI